MKTSFPLFQQQPVQLSLFFLVLFVCFRFTPVAAQSVVSVGPRLGLNLATFAGKNADNASIKPGINGGIFVNTRVSEDLGFLLELNYAQRGARNRINQQRTYRDKLNYVELPVLGKYYFGSGTRTSPFLQTGPNFAWLLNASSVETTEATVTKQYKRFDFGWTAGAGIEMRLENIRWTIDARFTPGLLKIPNSTNPLAIRNSVFTIGTAVGFVMPRSR